MEHNGVVSLNVITMEHVGSYDESLWQQGRFKHKTVWLHGGSSLSVMKVVVAEPQCSIAIGVGVVVSFDREEKWLLPP